MPEPQDRIHQEASSRELGAEGRGALLQKHPWVTFLLPLAVFMLVGSLEPTHDAVGGGAVGLAIAYRYYPLVYGVKIALTLGAIWFVLPGYRQFPLRLSPLAVITGVVGVVVWIGLCRLDVEQRLIAPALKSVRLDWLIKLGNRSGYNPLGELAGNTAWAWSFLAIRFFGLVVVAALVEEFFLRGFLMRFVVGSHWWEVQMGKVNGWTVALATLAPMAMHPNELLAAAVWFSMVTWLYVTTRNVWDCVAAHATTNLLLGVYVVATGQWQLM